MMCERVDTDKPSIQTSDRLRVTNAEQPVGGGSAVDRSDAQLVVGPRLELVARPAHVQHRARERGAGLAEHVRRAKGFVVREQPRHAGRCHLADRVAEHKARRVPGGAPAVGVQDVDDRRDQRRVWRGVVAEVRREEGREPDARLELEIAVPATRPVGARDRWPRRAGLEAGHVGCGGVRALAGAEDEA